MAFLDRVMGKNSRERELEREIRSLEVRKESVFTTINGEIERLQAEHTNVLLEAGTAAYDAWVQEKVSADLSEFWNKIQELEQQIVEQEKKRTEMGDKYDEEIRLINRNLQMAASEVSVSAAAPTTASTPFRGAGSHCSKCGAAIGSEDVFCQGCGTKLK